MNEKSVFYGLSPVQLMMAFAGGLAMFLSTKEAIKYISQSLGAAYVMFVAAAVCVILTCIFRTYEVIGAASLISMILFAIEYIIYCVNSIIDAGTLAILDISPHTAIYWAIIWAIPTLICMVIRMISLRFLDQKELLEDFSLFFRSSTISFYIFYTLIVLGTVIFTVPVGSGGIINFNFIPFYDGSIHHYFSSNMELYKSLGNLVLLLPIGYTLSVFYPKLKFWQKTLIGLGLGVLIQAIICLLNTGDFDITYIVLDILGLFIGILLKTFIDKLQYLISGKKQLAFRYF